MLTLLCGPRTKKDAGVTPNRPHRSTPTKGLLSPHPEHGNAGHGAGSHGHAIHGGGMSAARLGKGLAEPHNAQVGWKTISSPRPRAPTTGSNLEPVSQCLQSPDSQGKVQTFVSPDPQEKHTPLKILRLCSTPLSGGGPMSFSQTRAQASPGGRTSTM